jgi:hypothetical protein
MIAALALALLAADPPASPPPGPPVEAPAITVTGERLTDEAIAEGARTYVRSVLPTPSHGQYARWADPVCVKVTGIADSYAALVTARILAAARAADVRIAKDGCRPNLSVVFTEDAAITVAAIVRKQPKQIARLNGTERATLLTAPLPVRWWHGIELRGADGRAAAPAASSALMSAQSDGGVPLASVLPADAPQTDGWSSSLINSQVAVWATSGVVVVDIGLATGKPLSAVADYVAMVGLAPMKLPPAAPAVPSILGMFAGDAPATALSDWDKAFLASLYRIQMNRSAERQTGQLVTGIKADLSR